MKVIKIIFKRGREKGFQRVTGGEFDHSTLYACMEI
jgi:hypothetical protein